MRPKFAEKNQQCPDPEICDYVIWEWSLSCVHFSHFKHRIPETLTRNEYTIETFMDVYTTMILKSLKHILLTIYVTITSP